jgi:hypothetical protein
MFSLIRKGLIYKDINPEIVEHDEDIDGTEWCYDDRDVYRGQIDPRYTKADLDVYWLYDSDINKVGLVEYEKEDPTIFSVLWFRDNAYATLFQDDRWVSKEKTLWSILPYEAYLDCLEDDFNTLFDRCLSSKYRLVTPKFLQNPPTVYSCSNCHKQSIKPLKCHEKYIQKNNYFDCSSFLFIDDSYILYERPMKTSQNASSLQEQPEQPEFVQQEQPQ